MQQADIAAARRVSLLLLLGSLCGDFSHAAGDAACKALLQRDFGQTLDAPTRLTAAALVEPGGGVPAHCKLEGYGAPQVGLELGLPASNWNGKLLTQGCGAMCGMMLGSEACAEAVSRGYACVTTDMGHRSLPYDGKWAYNNPVAEIDLGHRATHVATLAARASRYSMSRSCPCWRKPCSQPAMLTTAPGTASSTILCNASSSQRACAAARSRAPNA